MARLGGSRPRGGLPLGALALIFLGVALLLNTLGIVPWGWWLNLGRLWPVILILVGIHLLWGRARPWVAAVAIVVVALVAIGVAGLASMAPPGQPATEELGEPLGEVSQAEVDIDFEAGELTLSSLPAGSDRLVQGRFEHGRGGRRVVWEFKRQDSMADLHLEVGQEGWRWFSWGDATEKWQLQLTPRIPVKLSLAAGASTIRLELTELQVPSLRLDVGASRATVYLPRPAGTVPIAIKAGAADIDILVPPEVAARIAADAGLASITIDEARFPRSGDLYLSPGYEQAAHRLDIDLDAGVSSVDIR